MKNELIKNENYTKKKFEDLKHIDENEQTCSKPLDEDVTVSK